MKYLLFLFIFIIHHSIAFTQSDYNTVNSSLFNVGYKNLLLTDSGRIYKPLTHPGEKLHLRPLEIDIWYPASLLESAHLMQYGEYTGLLEQRSNRFQNDTVYNNMDSVLKQFLCANLQISNCSQLSGLNTCSYSNADAIREKFPLIIYMTSYNGMSYENINLFEWLAAHGYIVASISSIGLYPGNMSSSLRDLMEQVNDGLYAIHFLKNSNQVDSTRIGIIGYSWGGLASCLASMNNPEIKVILSLDGSEMHYYGESAEEDMDFDQIRLSPYFGINRLKIPYTYIESGFKQKDRTVDSIFNMMPLLRGQKRYYRLRKASHEDFSCLPSLPEQIKETGIRVPRSYSPISQFALDYFDDYFKFNRSDLSAQTTAVLNQTMADYSYPALYKKTEFLIHGIVADSKNREALAYVNIGIPGKNMGTVSSPKGRFQFSISEELKNESIQFSMAGYLGTSIPVRKFLNRDSLTVFLDENNAVLNEVTISRKSFKLKNFGNRTTSHLISFGFPLKNLGGEIAIKINLGKKPVWLKYFHFNISYNRLDTAVFRLNIYNFRDGNPFENILRKNILVPVGKQSGPYSINLSDYKIYLKDDILLSLEWVEGASSNPKNSAIYLSAGFLNSNTWHKETSQGEWKKLTGMGVGYNLDVQTTNHTESP